MSDTNRVGVRVGRHPSGQVPRLFPITAPQTPANAQSLRLTGTPSFGFTPNVVDSQEFRSDRQKNKAKLVGFEAGGAIAIEFSPLTFDEVVVDAMFSQWVNTLRRAGTGANQLVDFAANTITLEGGAGTVSDFNVAHVVFVTESTTGFAEAYEVTAEAANAANTDLTVAHLGPSATDPGLETLTGLAATAQVEIAGFKSQAADEIAITAVSGNSATVTFTGAVDATSNVAFGSFGSETALVRGLWIKLSGFANAVNNIWTRVTAVGASSLTVETVTGAQSMVVEDPGPDDVELFFGDYIRNGVESVDDHSSYVERRFEDHPGNGTTEVTIGAVVNNLTLTLTPQAIMVGNIEYFGINARTVEFDDRVSGVNNGTDQTSIFASGVTPPTDVDAPAEDVLNTSTDIVNIATDFGNLINGTANFPLNASLTINNNARRRNAIGFQGAASIGIGEFDVTGNADTYFDTPEELAAVAANTTKRFNLAAVDPNSGRNFIADTPATSYTGGQATAQAKNQDTTLPTPFQAHLDPAWGYTLHIQRGAFSTA